MENNQLILVIYQSDRKTPRVVFHIFTCNYRFRIVTSKTKNYNDPIVIGIILIIKRQLFIYWDLSA